MDVRICLLSLDARASRCKLLFFFSLRSQNSPTLWWVPSQQLKRLQLVQNTAARIVTRTRKREHIKTVLRELHWLPVRNRIDHTHVLGIQMLRR